MKVNKYLKSVIVTIVLVTLNHNSTAQCANTHNIYSFEYDGRTYEVIKENKTWIEAVACAVERGGKLAEINDVNEQNEIQTQVILNAGINTANTVAPDGGGGAYIWLGGNDITSEGDWIWNGNNDASGTQFWNGNKTGGSVADYYENWGSLGLCPICPPIQNEPDNYNDNQNGLGLSLNGWPLGKSGQWNDVNHSNKLYYVVEYSAITKITTTQKLKEFDVFPNPANTILTITGLEGNVKLTLSNVTGNQVYTVLSNSETLTIDVRNWLKGVYFLTVKDDSGFIGKTKKVVITD